MQKYVAILALALLTAMQAAAGPAYAAKACATASINGAAESGPDQMQVRANAKRDWRNRVAATRGPLWSHWAVAAKKSVECRMEGGRIFQCRAIAIPCKELGSPDGRSGGKYKLVR